MSRSNNILTFNLPNDLCLIEECFVEYLHSSIKWANHYLMNECKYLQQEYPNQLNVSLFMLF